MVVNPSQVVRQQKERLRLFCLAVGSHTRANSELDIQTGRSSPFGEKLAKEAPWLALRQVGIGVKQSARWKSRIIEKWRARGRLRSMCRL
jgi:hypothetical protein